MEILLVIVVASAVIFFGALISMGNDRQRKAIDELREQVVLWAIQDLKIKGERITNVVNDSDPLIWFTKLVSKVKFINQTLRVTDVFENPPSFVVETETDNQKLIITPLSPSDLRKYQAKQNSRLLKYSNPNPLLSLKHKYNWYQISTLNGGVLFEVELRIAWRGLTGQDLNEVTQIFVYEL